jgi:hypothetical protein
MERLLKEFLWKEQIKRSSITIISGKCKKGADKLGEKFAAKYNLKLKEMPADWDTYKYAAGPIRNEEMARYAKKNGSRAILFAFWDGKSKGTLNMIRTANKYELQCITYDFIKKQKL